MSWWHYLLLVNFYLLLFFAFYALLLRRETFFQLNRIYLVAASLLSFAIPLIQAEWVKNLFITKQVQSSLYSAGAEFVVYSSKSVAPSVTIGHMVTGLYIIVTLFLTLRLLWQLIVLKKQIEKPSPSAAYSFFKKISLGKEAAEHEAIANHEQVHAKQWHSVDVMIIETVMIINWFNPVVYLYRFAIKYIHEYIADMQVISSGTDKADYALLLLSQTFDVPVHRLANPFYSQSMLKKRIMMLQKSRSHRIMLFKYCLSAPLFILMMILSSATVNNSTAVTSINNGVKKVLQADVAEVVEGISDHAEITPDEFNDEIPPPVVLPAVSAKGYYGNYNLKQEAYKNMTVEELVADNKVFVSVEQAPAFPGGLPALGKYLSENVKYPAQSREDGVQGKVFVTFVVEADGSLSDIRAVRGPSADLNAEGVRLISNSPKWDPGVQNGTKVRTQYTVPINFVLSDEDALPNDKVFTSVEKSPEFPGGMAAFGRYLTKNLKFPAEMRSRGLQGKVFVTFIVGADGQLSEIKALRGPSDEFKEEAIRVIANSPRWTPGFQNGRSVRVQYTIPIDFRIAFDDAQTSNAFGETPVIAYAQKPGGSSNVNSKPLMYVDGVKYE
ncbi:M56 family metallopeptidase [Mucilaginibacter auburnensis]|uniref:TonB family protein n=1 Tax=Mucilaginibacter auburnensis TaxID=1457233 RepID=A0A2H9VPL5_9SPHI|nr:M56 family metallopeptidase [Mucilaginibacter auburnensis]PJJ80299.1 TonB family protein [Mucilaginibacter auburnensis]